MGATGEEEVENPEKTSTSGLPTRVKTPIFPANIQAMVQLWPAREREESEMVLMYKQTRTHTNRRGWLDLDRRMSKQF